jgi:hypothetical protein
MHAWKYFQQSDRDGWLRFLLLQVWPAWITIHLLECWEILSFQGVWCGERHSWKTSMWQVGAVYSRQRRTLSRSMSVLSVRVLLPKAQKRNCEVFILRRLGQATQRGDPDALCEDARGRHQGNINTHASTVLSQACVSEERELLNKS